MEKEDFLSIHTEYVIILHPVLSLSTWYEILIDRHLESFFVFIINALKFVIFAQFNSKELEVVRVRLRANRLRRWNSNDANRYPMHLRHFHRLEHFERHSRLLEPWCVAIWRGRFGTKPEKRKERSLFCVIFHFRLHSVIINFLFLCFS